MLIVDIPDHILFLFFISDLISPLLFECFWLSWLWTVTRMICALH